MHNSWTPNQIKYIEYCATPRYSRIPPTKQLFADSISVNLSTLVRWQQKDGFQEAVTARAREIVGSSLPEVYGALVTKATMMDVPAIKLILELTGEYTPTQKNEQSGTVYNVIVNEPTGE